MDTIKEKDNEVKFPVKDDATAGDTMRAHAGEVKRLEEKVLRDFPNLKREVSGGSEPEVVTSNDPVISEDDLKLINKTRRVISTLNIEIKTVIGFTSDHLVEKYGIKSQEQFDRLFGSF